MSLSRRISLTLLLTTATLWSVSMGVCGLWLALTVSQKFSSWSAAIVAFGVTLLAMGQFVFMYLVADRLFPLFARRLSWCIEMPTVVVVVAGLLATVVLGLTGSST